MAWYDWLLPYIFRPQTPAPSTAPPSWIPQDYWTNLGSTSATQPNQTAPWWYTQAPWWQTGGATGTPAPTTPAPTPTPAPGTGTSPFESLWQPFLAGMNNLQSAVGGIPGGQPYAQALMQQVNALHDPLAAAWGGGMQTPAASGSPPVSFPFPSFPGRVTLPEIGQPQGWGWGNMYKDFNKGIRGVMHDLNRAGRQQMKTQRRITNQLGKGVRRATNIGRNISQQQLKSPYF